jgi:HupE / UreJ protein
MEATMKYTKYLLAAAGLLFFSLAHAHGVGEKDAAFVAQSAGAQIMPFLYLGAKHMVTGYDHLLFIFGVIFFLYRLRDVALYVTMFSIGHSITLLSGVLSNVHVNPYLVDAIIGLSVAYKAFDNLGGFKTFFKVQPNTKVAVLIFGLVHGFGLATKLQELHLAKTGLVTNLVSFNVGVELGQIVALSLILLLMLWWRKRLSFTRQSVLANVLLMTAGFVLMGYQLSGYFLQGAINGG